MSILFLDQNFMFLPLFPYSKLNIMYRKMYKTIHRSCASIQPAFSAYKDSTYRKAKCTILKSVEFLYRNTIKI